MSTVFFNLRIDEKLNDQLVRIAAEEGRSKNKQIEYILKEFVKEYLSDINPQFEEDDPGIDPQI